MDDDHVTQVVSDTGSPLRTRAVDQLASTAQAYVESVMLERKLETTNHSNDRWSYDV